MIPISLSISGFLSYRKPVSINFNSLDLACISGANGAGKSSLLDAMTWTLFGKARKNDDSLINAQSECAEVCLEFAYEGNHYRVKRAKPKDKTAVLEFNILHCEDGFPAVWRPLTEHTLRETQARIVETLRMDFDTFTNASFFLQGKADQFTTQGPADRKKILGSILGLEIWERYKTGAAERRKKVEGEIYSLDGRIQEIAAELNEEDQRRKRLEELETELQRLEQHVAAQEKLVELARKVAGNLKEQERWLENLGRQVEAAERRLSDQRERLAQRKNENEAHSEIIQQAGQIEADYTTWQAARKDLEHLEKLASRYRELEKLGEAPRLTLEAARARLQQELGSLQNRQLEIEKARLDADKLLDDIQNAEQGVKQAEHGLEQRKGFEVELQGQHRRQAELTQINVRMKSDMFELEEHIQQLEASEGAECPLCGQPLSMADRQALIERLTAQGKEMGDRYRENQGIQKEIGERIETLEEQINELRQADADLRRHGALLASAQKQWEILQKNIAEWEANGAPRLAEDQAALDGEAFEPEARRRLAEIDGELQKTGYDPAAHAAARAAEEAGRSSEARMRDLQNARAAQAPLLREIGELEEQIAAASAEVTEQREEYESTEAALASARQTAPDLKEAETLYYILVEELNQLRREAGAADQKVRVLTDLKKKRDEFEAQRESFGKLVKHYKKLERAFGKDGVPALLIEQALPEIEMRANDVLARLSDGVMSVRFVTQAAFKDKARDDLKETLEIQISDGAGQREYELFSGGEAFRVNFAIRLALSEVLAQRAGARLQTLVIDEGFGSQDQFGRQRLVEAINMVRHDFEKILVITHIDELKDAFPHRIEVEKTPDGSEVHVV